MNLVMQDDGSISTIRVGGQILAELIRTGVDGFGEFAGGQDERMSGYHKHKLNKLKRWKIVSPRINLLSVVG